MACALTDDYLAQGIEVCEPCWLLLQREPQPSGFAPQADLVVMEGDLLFQQGYPSPLGVNSTNP